MEHTIRLKRDTKFYDVAKYCHENHVEIHFVDFFVKKDEVLITVWSDENYDWDVVYDGWNPEWGVVL